MDTNSKPLCESIDHTFKGLNQKFTIINSLKGFVVEHVWMNDLNEVITDLEIIDMQERSEPQALLMLCEFLLQNLDSMTDRKEYIQVKVEKTNG